MGATELSAETRARILGTAWQLVTDKGAGAVTVKEVAAQAGVSAPARSHFHYQNRAGLLLAMARHQDRSSGFLRAVAAARDLAPVPGFEALLRAWCAYLAKILPVARALEATYITRDEGGDAWRDRMTELREALRLALARIEAEGGLAPGWIAETAADSAWARVQPGSWGRAGRHARLGPRSVHRAHRRLVAGRARGRRGDGHRVRSGLIAAPDRSPAGSTGDAGSRRPGSAGRRRPPGTPPPGPGRGSVPRRPGGGRRPGRRTRRGSRPRRRR